jgi:hypothetical protein
VFGETNNGIRINEVIVAGKGEVPEARTEGIIVVLCTRDQDVFPRLITLRVSSVLVKGYKNSPSTLSRPIVDTKIEFVEAAPLESLKVNVVPIHVLAAGNKMTLLSELTSIFTIGEIGTIDVIGMWPLSMDTG